jgi:HNH endonuclease
VHVRHDEVIEKLEDALGDAAALPLPCLSRAEVGEWLCRLQSLRARFDAVLCEATAHAEAGAVHALDGQRTISAYVASHTPAEPTTVAADARLGRWLGGYPLFSAAFTSGRIHRRHVMALRSVDKPRTRAALSSAQEYLVEAAADCDWDGFVKMLRYWVLGSDPDGDEPREQVAARQLSVTKRTDGMVKGNFLLDPLTGDAVKGAIDRLSQAMFRQDSADASAGSRTATQLRADAVAQLITKGAANPNAKVAPPLVHLVMSERLAELLLAHVGDGPAPELPLHPHDIDSRCELVDGTPIHPEFAARALAVGTLRRLVIGTDGEILDLGTKVRLFPAHLKQALLVAARGRCEVQGCDAPFSWLQADHIEPASRGGPTSVANGQILCDPHNKAKRDRVDGGRQKARTATTSRPPP